MVDMHLLDKNMPEIITTKRKLSLMVNLNKYQGMLLHFLHYETVTKMFNN